MLCSLLVYCTCWTKRHRIYLVGLPIWFALPGYQLNTWVVIECDVNQGTSYCLNLRMTFQIKLYNESDNILNNSLKVTICMIPVFSLFIETNQLLWWSRNKNCHYTAGICHPGLFLLILTWCRNQMEKHLPRCWPYLPGIPRSPVNSPHKGQWRGALIFCVVCARTNCWTNTRDAGDLRRHGAHYDVTVMTGVYFGDTNWNLNTPNPKGKWTSFHASSPFY